MNMFKKYIHLTAAAAVIGIAFTACSDKEDVVYVDEIYQRAYLTSEFYPQSGGEFFKDDVMSDPKGYFDANCYFIFSEGGLMTTTSGKQDYDLYLKTNYAAKSNITGQLVPLPNPEEYIKKYNNSNGYTGEEAFKLFPEAYYTIVKAVATIPAGQKESPDTLRVVLNDDFIGLEVGNYLLPLTCSINGDVVEMSESMGVYNIKIIYTYVDERADPSAGIPEPVERQLKYNTDFTAALTAGSNYVGSLAQLFDGNPVTGQLVMASSKVAKYSLNFVNPVKVSRFGYVAFSKNSGGWGNTYYPPQTGYEIYYTDGGTDEVKWFQRSQNDVTYFEELNLKKEVSRIDICWDGATWMGIDEIIVLASTK